MTDTGGTHIAVVADDVAEVRTLLAEFLQRRGFEVFCASSGREAARLLRENACELLVTDVLMPDGDGIELISELKSANHAVRIVAISGGGMLSPHYCLTLARGVGAHAFLQKPFDRSQLLAAVDLAMR